MSHINLICFLISVENVREASENVSSSPISIAHPNVTTTVVVDDTLEAELMADIDATADDGVQVNSNEDDKSCTSDDSADSDCDAPSDVEMRDISEKGLESVANLFG